MRLKPVLKHLNPDLKVGAINMQSRRKISFLLLLIIGLVLGIVIKNIKIGMIIGIAIGLFAGSLGSKKE